MPRHARDPHPADPVGPVVPETPTVPADPVPGPEQPDLPEGPDAPAPDDPLPPQPDGPEVPSPDPGGRPTSPKASARDEPVAGGEPDPGCDFLDPFELGVLFIGIAVFAAVGALSHQHERAFSASLIYLGLGAGAAVVIAWLDIGWIDPIDDAELIEHLTEAALVMALFSAGLKLDRPLTFRDWSSDRAAAAARDAGHDRRRRAARLHAARPLGRGRAAARRGARADRPGARRRHRRRPARRRGRARAELRADLRGRAQRRARGPVRAARRSSWPRRAAAAGRWSGSPPTSSRRSAIGLAIGAGVGVLAAWSVKRLRSHDMLVAAFDGFHAIATVLVIYGLAELAGGYGFLARLRGRARVPPLRARPRAQRARPRGRRAAGEAARARRDPAARLDAHARRASARTGLGGLAARGAAARGRAAARLPRCRSSARSMDQPGREGVRRVVRRARRRHALLPGGRSSTPACSAPPSRTSWCGPCIAAVLVSIVVHGITAGPSMRRLLLRRRARSTRRRLPARR